jgi:hypothetical protein
MLEFLKYIYITSFKEGDIMLNIISIFMWILSLIIVVLILWGILYLCDSVGLELKEGTGVITEKGVHPAHTTTTWMNVNKVMVPITTHHPESYYLTINIDGLVDEFNFDTRAEWDKFKEGSKVTCQYGNGRLFNSIHINSLKF